MGQLSRRRLGGASWKTAAVSPEVGIPIADEIKEISVISAQQIDLLTTVATEQPDAQEAAAAADDPPHAAGGLPPLQNRQGILAHIRHCDPRRDGGHPDWDGSPLPVPDIR